MKPNILIVQEDNHSTKRLAEYLSASQSFGRVDVCYDGESAITIISETRPQIVILDLVLPIKDGFTVMEYFKSKDFCPKFYILTVVTMQKYVANAFKMGAEHFFVKPTEPMQILNKILATSGVSENAAEQSVSLNHSFKYKNRSLDERISAIFMSVGIPAHIKGYQFLRAGIKLAVEDPPIINNITKCLYPTIAVQYQTTSSKVERAIRHAIEVAWNRGKIENINTLFGVRVYSANEKPTNGEFIALLADKMLLEGIS